MNTKGTASASAPVQSAPVVPRATAVQAALFSLLCAVSCEGILRSVGAQDFYSNDLAASFGRVLVLFLLLYINHRFSMIASRAYRPDLKNLGCISLALIGTVCIIWVGRILSAGLSVYLASSQIDVPAHAFYFAIPYATGALLLQAVLGLHYGLVFSIGVTIIECVYSPSYPLIAPFVLATNLIACLSLSRFRSRSAYLKAGLNISLIALPLALASVIVNGNVANTSGVVMILAAAVGGFLCALVASGLTPIVEYVGGYVTDMRLIEMATLDHPLLKELSIQAPGTWNHCMVMGMMVEAAADAIGVNPVLARVGAYFHDIGKIKKPLYFVENQIPGENRHDKLSTSMSALIIRSHVKDGIELARKYGLPRVIEDMIPQHHGTSRIEFFYDKALKEAEEAGDEAIPVDESLYRYPGPKPQTREAGILMLADGIEAAARTLQEPNFDRIQGMVQKMMNKVFASGELNECDLTLRDLHQIAKCFTRILSGIYHQRIAYAEPVEKGAAEKPAEKAAEKVIPEEGSPEEGKASESAELGGESPSEEQKSASKDKGTKATAKEDLKRLGLS